MNKSQMLGNTPPTTEGRNQKPFQFQVTLFLVTLNGLLALRACVFFSASARSPVP